MTHFTKIIAGTLTTINQMSFIRLVVLLIAVLVGMNIMHPQLLEIILSNS